MADIESEPTTEQTRIINVLNRPVRVDPDDTAADVLVEVGSEPDKNMLIRGRGDDPWENKVPFDLSGVEDGESLWVYRPKVKNRPAYEEVATDV